MRVPESYTIQKFFEYVYQPKYNRYNNTYQGGCPICREGKSFGRKQRFYYVPENDNMFCHNCGWSSKPFKWLQRVSGISTLEIIQELKNFDMADMPEIEESSKKVKYDEDQASLPLNCINLFDKQQLEYWKDNETVKLCLNLIKKRKLDVAINKPDALYVSLDDAIHPNRLIIPFANETGQIDFYQSRAMTPYDLKNTPKYTSKLGADKSVFSLNHIDNVSDNVFIFEGPIDAFFVKNSVAIAGITESGDKLLNKHQSDQFDRVLRFKQKIWCLDSQWLDEASMSVTDKLIARGETVFIWPKDIGQKFKDFNDVICSSSHNEIPEGFILRNSFKGIEGVLKLAVIKQGLNL